MVEGTRVALGLQIHLEGVRWTLCLSGIAFDSGEGKSLCLEWKWMFLLTLTWREGRVLAPSQRRSGGTAPVWIFEGGEQRGGRGPLSKAISFHLAALCSRRLQYAHPSRSSLGKIYF